MLVTKGSVELQNLVVMHQLTTLFLFSDTVINICIVSRKDLQLYLCTLIVMFEYAQVVVTFFI